MTLVEMTVVVGILGVLVGLLMPALSSVRSAGRQTKEMSAARQLMFAWTNYANVQKGRVMPGYKSGLRAVDAEGRSVAELTVPVAAARYPWRIAPYLDFDFRGLYANDQERVLEEFRNVEDEANRIYYMSLVPSLGLNATWVGGNEHVNELGFDDQYRALFGRFYVERLTEVVRPDRLLVFASARGVDPLGGGPDGIDGVVEGYFEVRSPRLTAIGGTRWTDSFRSGDDPVSFGFVSPRYGGEAVTAFVDCHAETLTADQLHDMRYWANRAETAEYALEPATP